MALREGRLGDKREPFHRVRRIVVVRGPEPTKPRVVDEARGEDLRECVEIGACAMSHGVKPRRRHDAWDVSRIREPGYGSSMYIGGGFLVLVLIILAIIYLAKRV